MLPWLSAQLSALRRGITPRIDALRRGGTRRAGTLPGASRGPSRDREDASASSLWLSPDVLDALESLAGELRLVLETGASGGRFAGRLPGPGHEFHDFRPFTPGDDARHVSWRRYARDGQLLVAQRAGELRPRTQLLLDLSGSMTAPATAKDRFARQLALALAFVWHRAGGLVRLAAFQEDRLLEAGDRPLRGPAELQDDWMPWLASLEASGATRFSPLELAAEASRLERGHALVLSDFAAPPEHLSRQMAELADGHDPGRPHPEGAPLEGLDRLVDVGHRVGLVRIYLEEELELPERGYIADAETPGLERLIGRDAANRQLYRAALRAHVAALQDWADESGGWMVDLEPGMGLVAAVSRIVETLGEAR